MFAFPRLFRIAKPRRDQPAAAAAAPAVLVYDGECPLCNHYAGYVAARQNFGGLRLVNARDGGPLVQEIRDLPHNLQEGMALKLGGRYYLGADALYMLAWHSDRRGFCGRLNGLLFRSAAAARLSYPLLKLGRRCLLRLKGAPPLG